MVIPGLKFSAFHLWKWDEQKQINLLNLLIFVLCSFLSNWVFCSLHSCVYSCINNMLFNFCSSIILSFFFIPESRCHLCMCFLYWNLCVTCALYFDVISECFLIIVLLNSNQENGWRSTQYKEVDCAVSCLHKLKEDGSWRKANWPKQSMWESYLC